MPTQKRKRLGDLLVDAKVITDEQLQAALLEQQKTKLRLGEQLIKLNLVTEQQLIEVLEFQLGIPHVNLSHQEIDPKLIHIISEEMARRYQVFPLKKRGNKLIVAMSDPLDYFAIDDLRLSTGFQIEPVIAKKEELKLAINRYYGMQQSIDQMMEGLPEDETELALLEAQQTDDSPVANMLNQLISQAVQLGASDIHIDPGEQTSTIRLRIDGMLRIERTLPYQMHSVLVARVKVVANLDITEKRLPQDGRFQLDVEFRKVDLRVSCVPTIFGEKVVIRILDTNKLAFGLDTLGFSAENELVFRKMINQAYGLILVTGPTGSGKSTTLYSALQHLNAEDVNIITVEDPVEYQLKGINQIQVNPTIGMNFAVGLRSILRQDPDIIMVGEIRDTETAKIALQAALTGHLVLSTLHTNNALSTISRLMDMGIEPFLISSALVGVVAQRLVRKVCTACAEPYRPLDKELSYFTSRNLPQDKLVKGKGCHLCNQTGYKGRLAIQEVLLLDEPLRNMVIQKRTNSDFRHYLTSTGFSSMFEDGLVKVAEGLTTLEELYRVAVDL